MAAVPDAVTGAFLGLSPREKRMLIALAVVLGFLAFVGLYFWSASRLDSIDEDRAATLDALQTIQRARGQIAARNARRDAMLARYRNRAPPLTSFVEEQARGAGVRVAESQDRPPEPAGRQFTQRAVSIRLHQVSLQALVDFLSRIDNAPFPVAITSLRVHRRYGESNAYDIDDMVIATWDAVPESAGSQGSARNRHGRHGGNARTGGHATEEAP